MATYETSTELIDDIENSDALANFERHFQLLNAPPDEVI